MENQVFDLSQFAVGRAQSPRNTVSIKDLSVEDARAYVKVVDGNIKKKVEGFQGLTLKLSRVKLSLDIIQKGAQKLQVPEAQVEAVSDQLLGMVDAGNFDTAIEEALVRLNTVVKSEAPSEEVAEEDFEGEEEYEEEE